MRQVQQQRNATIIQPLTEVETEESIYERLRRKALQENEQIRQDWQNKKPEQNNITQFENQREVQKIKFQKSNKGFEML